MVQTSPENTISELNIDEIELENIKQEPEDNVDPFFGVISGDQIGDDSAKDSSQEENFDPLSVVTNDKGIMDLNFLLYRASLKSPNSN